MNIEDINKLKAEAVMDFVNIQVEAFDAGHVDSCEVSLFSLYRFAQLHVKDNYSVDVIPMTEEHGFDFANTCRSYDEGPLTTKE